MLSSQDTSVKVNFVHVLCSSFLDLSLLVTDFKGTIS